MFQDWQTIAVWLIIVAALLYVGRRGLSRLRSFRAGGRSQDACASGCGSCGEEQSTMTATNPQNVLVQITNAGSASPKRQGKTSRDKLET